LRFMNFKKDFIYKEQCHNLALLLLATLTGLLSLLFIQMVTISINSKTFVAIVMLKKNLRSVFQRESRQWRQIYPPIKIWKTG